MCGRSKVRFLPGTQNFSLSHTCDMMITFFFKKFLLNLKVFFKGGGRLYDEGKY